MLEIKFIKNWMDYNKNTIINCNDKGAKHLVELGFAELTIKEYPKEKVTEMSYCDYAFCQNCKDYDSNKQYCNTKNRKSESFFTCPSFQQIENEELTIAPNKVITPDARGSDFETTDYYKNISNMMKYQPMFYDRNELYWIWDGKNYKWNMIDETDVIERIASFMKFKNSILKSKNEQGYLRAVRLIGRRSIPKDAPKEWIQFKDKIFDIKTKQIFNATFEYFLCNPIPWSIGETSETILIDKLFNEWVGEKDKLTLYELLAYCCYSDYPIQTLICMIGCGRNGKSQYQKVLTKFIGNDNVTSTDLDVLVTSRFEIAKLYKKLACILGETNFSILNKTSIIKKACGGDMLGIEFKGKTPFDMVNYAKIIINSNSLPISEDESEGFYRRWLIIDFPNKFEEGKDIFQTIPESDYNAIAKKITEILPDLILKGKFTNQGSIEDRKHKYIMASNPLVHFIDNTCNKDVNGFTRYSELYTAYVQYLALKNKRIVSRKEFGKVLDIEGYEVKKTNMKINDEFVSDRWIFGIILKPNWKEIVTIVTNVTYSSTSLKNEKDYSGEVESESHSSHSSQSWNSSNLVYNYCNKCKKTPCNQIQERYYCKDCFEEYNNQIKVQEEKIE